MNKPRYIIAVDPDIYLSGFAVIDTIEKKVVDACTLSLFKLIEKCGAWASTTGDYIVLVEASWNTTRTHRIGYNDNKAVAAKRGYAVGMNHMRGKDIVEGLKHYGIKHEEVPPLRKCWKGKEGKITHEEIISVMKKNGIAYNSGRTNQEVRDSLLICLIYGNLLWRI